MSEFDASDDENDETGLAGEIMSGSKSANTRIQYGRKIKIFDQWVTDKHSECLLENGKVDLLRKAGN